MLLKEVYEAFEAHHYGRNSDMSDQEYDYKLAKLKEIYPDINLFKMLPESEENKVYHRDGIIELMKYSVYEISDSWTKEEGKVKTPKWDGSSIIIYYHMGKLSHIVSMGDKNSGVDQTTKFWDHVPHSVPLDVSFIRAEVVCDVNLVDNPRGEANGIVNSKYMQDKVDRVATLIAHSMVDIQGKTLPYRRFSDLKISTIARKGSKVPRFIISPQVHECELLERGFCRYKNVLLGVDIQVAIDGIVYSEDDEWHCPWSYKYYFLTSAHVPVTDIVWNETNKEGYTSVLRVEPTELDGKTIYGPGTNGVPNLIRLGCGVGSIIEVAFSGTTIPQIISVVKEAPVELPKCNYCEYQMTEDDIYRAVLKCGNEDCPQKYDIREGWLWNIEELAREEGLTVRDYMLKYIVDYAGDYLNISGFNAWNRKVVTDKILADNIVTTIELNDYEGFREVILNSFNFTSLQYSEALLVLKAQYKLLSKYLKQ